MPHIVRFDCFEADLDSGQLRKRGMKIKLRDQCSQVLASLLERPGSVVTRENLRQRLWGEDVFVDFENNLNTVVARLREKLGDSVEHPRFIETLPKRGYRFIAPVSPQISATSDSATRRARLVVLPFLNLGGDPAQEYFSDAMTDEIITELASLAPEQLAAIARTTAMHYKGSHKDVAHIGRELGVDYIVEGAVRHTENQAAINVQLIQTSDQTHLFTRKYETELRDIFHIQRSIARDIAAHIPAIAGTVHGEHVTRKPTKDLAAYTEYIRGRCEMWKATPDSVSKAKEHFEAALARDPDFALAHCGLAHLYWYLGFWGYRPSKETDLVGRFYVLRAIELDATLAEGHALLSYYPKQQRYNDRLCYYDWPASLKDVSRARELNPTSQLVQLRYAIVLMVLGRTEEAAAVLEHALESDPLSLEMRGWFVEILLLGRQYERAIEQGLQLVDLEPEHTFPSYFALGNVYLAMQRYEESTAAQRRAVELSGELPHMLGCLGLALGLGGRIGEARAVLDRLRALAGQRYVPPTCFAWTHLGLGEIDEAFAWMDRAVDAPDRMLSPIKSYPFLDPLRSDRRFSALLRKMNLEP